MDRIHSHYKLQIEDDLVNFSSAWGRARLRKTTAGEMTTTRSDFDFNKLSQIHNLPLISHRYEIAPHTRSWREDDNAQTREMFERSRGLGLVGEMDDG